MARIKRTKKGYLVDEYIGGKRVRKVHPTREAVKEWVADETKKATDEKYFGVVPEEFETFNELADWYLKHPKVKRKKSYRDSVLRVGYFKDYFGTKRLRDIRPEHLEEYIDTRLKAPCSYDHRVLMTQR
jgi:hypothetical protein